MDDHFERLEKRGVGCNIGNYFVGCLAYADDLTLLAPSKKAFQIMICQGYASDYNVIFNGQKSQFIIFRGTECRTENSYVLVKDEQLNNISSAVHLSAVDSEYTISASVASVLEKFKHF